MEQFPGASTYFLHGNFDETVYMHQPPGFDDPKYPEHVCLRKKSLNGLKQEPRVWYQDSLTMLPHWISLTASLITLYSFVIIVLILLISFYIWMT